MIWSLSVKLAYVEEEVHEPTSILATNVITTPDLSAALYSTMLERQKTLAPLAQTSVQTTTQSSTKDRVYQVHPSVTSKAKRFIDIAGALVGLGITAVVAIPVAIAVQLDDPGPIFYSQIRCGLKGKPFRIWKFRSMVMNADKLKHLVNNEAKGGIFKNKNDPRVTRIGRVLRKTSLDELPQFWNVLRGEMSLVGTRPPTVDEVIGYKRHHWERLKVKPGITGEWQANGRSEVTDFEDVVKMDLTYQQKWSIAYDLLLILKTIQVVLNKQGAC